jgi:ABC-2 type transport system permease protein
VDRSNPLAGGLVEGRVQAAAAAATLEALPLPGLDPDALSVPIKIVDALGRTGKRPSIAFFAAGLGVLFLMFAVTGRGAVLIDERETGVLSRILASRVGLLRLLLGRWLFLAGLGTVQVIVMFLWAAAGFGLDLFNPRCLVGFLAVTVITAAAASAFGMVLAAACRTRVQLQGVAVVVILGLCAVGGNLFPSFLMPAGLRDAGRLTFNAWALSAYQKVFWYEQGVAKLLPELTLLILSAGLFFAVAWLIARGWQRTGGLA